MPDDSQGCVPSAVPVLDRKGPLPTWSSVKFLLSCLHMHFARAHKTARCAGVKCTHTLVLSCWGFCLSGGNAAGPFVSPVL